MARTKKTAAVAAESPEVTNLTIGVSTMSENSETTMKGNIPDTQKHVALAHLYIIREYIDKQVNKAISSADGLHGIRYYNGKLQAKDAATDEWIDIATGGTGEGSGGTEIADDKDVEDLFS